MKNEKSCGAFIIDNNNKILIIKQNNGDYGFPKGHVENNETEMQTALREVKEETGVDIDFLSNKRYSISYLVKDNTVNKEVVYFLAKLTNKDNLKKQDEEISEIKWVDINDVYDILYYDNIKNLWLKAKEDIN